MPRDVFPRTIARGVLTGRTFATKWEYQQARARELGFRTYSEERSAKQNPIFILLRERAMDRGETRTESINVARRIVTTERISRGPRQGRASTRSWQERQRMKEIIRDAYDSGLYDPGEDAADDLFYE